MPDYKSINASYKVSNDGKTVTIKGKTHSKDAFMKRFFGLSADKGSGAPGSSFYGSNAVKRGMSGEATRELVQEPVKSKVASSPDKAKSRAEKSAKKAGLKALNKGLNKLPADRAPSLRPRAQGGIAVPGAYKQVNPVYRMGRGGGLGGAGGIPENK